MVDGKFNCNVISFEILTAMHGFWVDCAPFDFCLIAILGRLKAFGCNLSELCQDFLNSAIDPQYAGLC